LQQKLKISLPLATLLPIFPPSKYLHRPTGYISTQQFKSFLSKYNFAYKQTKNLGGHDPFDPPLLHYTPMTRRDFTLRWDIFIIHL